MKMRFACPNCGTHKKISGRRGKKIILICDKCNFKGRGTIPFTKNQFFKKNISKRNVLTGIFGLLIFLLIFSFIILPVINGDMHFLTVQSGSMEPDIKVGDVVVSVKTNPRTISVGDVITYRYDDDRDPNRCFTHRVVEIVELENEGRTFQTKGDANEDLDKRLVKMDEVIGRVSFVVPFLGHFGNFARSIFGYIIFILLPALLIIVFEIYKIFNIKKSNIKKP